VKEAQANKLLKRAYKDWGLFRTVPTKISRQEGHSKAGPKYSRGENHKVEKRGWNESRIGQSVHRNAGVGAHYFQLNRKKKKE